MWEWIFLGGAGGWSTFSLISPGQPSTISGVTVGGGAASGGGGMGMLMILLVPSFLTEGSLAGAGAAGALAGAAGAGAGAAAAAGF